MATLVFGSCEHFDKLFILTDMRLHGGILRVCGGGCMGVWVWGWGEGGSGVRVCVPGCRQLIISIAGMKFNQTL